MAQSRKTLPQHAAEIEQWIAWGWLTGHETFIELQDMATMTELIYQEASRSADVQAEIFGIKGRFQEVLAPRMPKGVKMTLLEALMPILEAHPRHVARDGAILVETPNSLIGQQRRPRRHHSARTVRHRAARHRREHGGGHDARAGGVNACHERH